MKRRAKECVGLDGFAEDLLLKDMHVQYVKRSSEDKDAIEYVLTDHLRLSGMYWGLTSLICSAASTSWTRTRLSTLRSGAAPDVGGYAPCVYHDAHVLYTLSAVQILALFDRMELIDRDAIASFLTRCRGRATAPSRRRVGRGGHALHCAPSISTLIDRPHCIDRGKAVEDRQVQKLRRRVRQRPGRRVTRRSGVHVRRGALCDAVDRIDHTFWGGLAERQVKAGGLNGRPEKLPDVCYSWWVLSSLCIMGKMHWIDQKALARFILGCQDEKKGIADRPDDEPDVHHTFFGLAALSLMGSIKPIDPVLRCRRTCASESG